MISKFYNVFLKRTSTMYLSVIVAAFFFERAVDVGCDTVFERINEGKLWKQIKGKYEK